MKPPVFDYVAPETLEEALIHADEAGPDGKILAGGQSLMPVLNFRLAAPSILIDLNRLPTLSGLRILADARIEIGAMTRTRRIETDPDIAAAHPLLAHVAPFISHMQIRNRGTIGGSLCHADPAAEFPAIALLTDAELVLQRRDGTRSVAAADFFRTVFTTAVDDGEILTAVRFPAWPAARRFGFQEYSRRHGDFAIVGCGATIDAGAGEAPGCARIAAFGVADRPIRLHETESLIADRGLDPDSIAVAARAAAEEITPETDLHASADYRRDLIRALVGRMLNHLQTAPGNPAVAA